MSSGCLWGKKNQCFRVGGWSSFSNASEIPVENWQFDKLKIFGNLAKKEFGVRSVL